MRAYASSTQVVLARVHLLHYALASGYFQGTKVTVSIGGWTGSRYFSNAVGSEANRIKFVDAIATLVNNYTLDGVDFE
jgi:chitinase